MIDINKHTYDFMKDVSVYATLTNEQIEKIERAYRRSINLIEGQISSFKRLQKDSDLNTLRYLKNRTEGLSHDQVKHFLNPNR